MSSARAILLHLLAVGTATLAAAACSALDGSGNRSSASQRPTSSSATPSAAGTGGSDTHADAGPPPTRVTAESLDVAGDPRSFVLAMPTTYSTARTYPLVLVLHGDSSDGASVRAALGLEYASGGDAIVAYPNGHDGWDLYDPASSDGDLAFLVALVDSLESRFSIDRTRVFGMGFSSGAFMINQVACRRPALFRAIAPHSGGAPSEPNDPSATTWSNAYTRCAGQTMGSGPAVMVIHGTADTEVTFQSGDFTASYWAFVDGCDDTRSQRFSPAPCVADVCPQGKDVVLCPIPGLGHAIWQGAADAAWGFFRSM